VRGEGEEGEKGEVRLGQEKDTAMPRNIASGQRISESKYLESKILRRRMTPAESRLWTRLRKNQIGGFHFRRQQIIHGFIVDFYCHTTGLIVEVDGAVHGENIEADHQRDAILCAAGFNILRFTNEEVLKNADAVIGKIMETCNLKS
jgi:very-short-patch-repair endonuclease